MKKQVLTPLRPFYLILYHVCYLLFVWIARILWPLRVIGRENLPQKGGYIMAPAHVQAIDPMFMLIGRGYLRNKKMLVMAKEELFEINGLVNFLWHLFGAFPVERGAGNRDLIDAVVEEVKLGRGLFIFPEGTRTPGGNEGALGKLKSGAFVVAQQTGAAMVPCRIYYSAGKFKMFRRTTVAYGKPVTMEELGLTGEYSVKKIRAAKEIYIQRLDAVWQQGLKAIAGSDVAKRIE